MKFLQNILVQILATKPDVSFFTTLWVVRVEKANCLKQVKLRFYKCLPLARGEGEIGGVEFEDLKKIKFEIFFIYSQFLFVFLEK